ncbi:MAG: hypothetical protein LC437_05080, partial [Thiohalomonas sp.]|nr:hypothetical protein [Thiohalomonas sp.]
MGQLNPALQFSELSNKKGSHQTRVLREYCYQTIYPGAIPLTGLHNTDLTTSQKIEFSAKVLANQGLNGSSDSNESRIWFIPNQLENAGSNTWKLSLIRESNDFPMLG